MTPGIPRKSYKITIDYLNKIFIFNKLSPSELKFLINYLQCIGFSGGDILAHEGEKGNHVYFIIEGKMDVIKEGQGGKSIIISTLGKGRSIGEMSIIDDSPRSATLIAKTDIVLLKFSKDGFNKILEEHPETGMKILKGLTRLLSMNLRKTSSRLADYMTPLC